MKTGRTIAVALLCLLAGCQQAPGSSQGIATESTAASLPTPVSPPAAQPPSVPAIKGIRLGMGVDEVAVLLKGTVAPMLHAHDDAGIHFHVDGGVTGSPELSSNANLESENYNACFGASDLPQGGYLYGASKVNGNEKDEEGTSPLDKRVNHMTLRHCYLWIHAGSDRKVDAFYVSDDMAKLWFDAERMTDQAFYQTFINAYGIPKLQTSPEEIQNIFKPEEPMIVTVGFYESPDGWRIDFQGKAFTMRAETPTAARFN